MDEPVLADATDDDLDDLRRIFADVVQTGAGFPDAAPLTDDRFRASWVDPPVVVVAKVDGRVVGAYYLKPNFPGRASHIANAGYIVAAAERGRGIGRRMVEDSIRRAPGAGFRAIIFNLVFASNPARALYETLGWRQIGEIPDGVDGEPAIIYWRSVS